MTSRIVYTLPDGGLTKEQALYFLNIIHAGNNVLFSKFGDMEPITKFRELAAELPQLFEADALIAAETINSYGGQIGEETRRSLHLIHCIQDLSRDNISMFSFNENFTEYQSYYMEFIFPIFEKYDIDDSGF